MSDADKSGSFFWTALENIIRPQSRPVASQNSDQIQFDQSLRASNFSSSNESFAQEACSDEIYRRLNGLKQTEPFEVRLKSFEDLIKLSELFFMNEALINNLLKLSSDLFKIDQTPFDVRTKAFEYLTLFYQKKTDKFDTFMLRNHLLGVILINSKASKCIFLNTLNKMKFNQTETPANINSNNNQLVTKLSIPNDDIKFRFNLFLSITKNGNYCKHLDPDLMSECLMYFLENSEHLNDRYLDNFELFKNIIANRYFQYINENLLTLLTRCLLNFSFSITNLITANENYKPLTRQQKQEIKICVELIEKVIENITTTVCINYVVLCLCELLDITTQNQNRSDVKVNRIDSQMTAMNDSIITHIYECMHKLFVSPIGNCAIFTFFSEIFPINKKYQVHRKHQINGALMHIKQIFDDFKHSKLKNSYLIKELHLNCLIYLPNALKSCYSDCPKDQQLIMFENILNLTLELVHLASHKDLFMCLLTYKSRKFFIEIVNQFSTQILENESLIKKYADLLNLLDVKDVFSYKTSNKEPSQSLLRNTSSASLNKENIDESTLIFQNFKESFYDLVYKFPCANYLKDNCINNCIEFYLQRKFLPIYSSQSIYGIKALFEKYISIKNQYSITVRKFLIDSLHRKMKEYYQIEQKSFIEELIKEVLLNVYEMTIIEDDSNYRSMGHNVEKSAYVHDLFEMKYFIVLKLIELINFCQDEDNVFKIIKIFEKLIGMERVSSIELLVPHNLVSPSNQPSSNLLFYPNPQINTQSNCLNYLYKIINNGLIEIFEKYFNVSSHSFTRCSIEIFNILVKYLDYYYLTQYNFNQSNSGNNPSSLSSIAAESLPVQNQIQAQSNAKFFNYYSNIRKEIFEFLLRIRSNSQSEVLLIDRKNRRQFIKSNYLMLNICETKNENEGVKELRKCEIDFGKILKLIEFCLDKEMDWNVITKLLLDLPYMMQYEMDLIKNSDFTDKLFNLINKKEISSIRNKPENLTKQDYISKFYPLLASLTLYHFLLEKNSQENILQNLVLGVHSGRNLYCLEILTIAITEMHETNAIQCGEILLKLSQFSSSQNMAQPILELLSTISDFKKIHTVCGIKEFIAVLATAIKYTDPFKFNAFIILFAHYVLCVWFLKCKPEFRKSYASFTSRGLYQEVIAQLDNKIYQRESKSPNKLPEGESLNNSQKRLSTVETVQNQKGEATIKTASSESLSNKMILSDQMKQFYRDLVEITMDFMSNNMNYDCSLNSQTSSSHNRGEFIVDRFSNVGTNQNSLFENREPKSNGQKTKLWLVGNKIIQITTGSFSNICNEEPSNLLQRKHKTSKSKTSQHSQAIDIPIQSAVESIASSNNSSASLSVNNSFSSVSVNSNFIEGKKCDLVIGGTNTYGKSEQDFFDAMVDGGELEMQKSGLVQQSSIDETSKGSSIRNEPIFDSEMNRRSRLVKRRYKSGLPLTNDRNDDDSAEEAYLKSNNESYRNFSKDDSALNTDPELFPPFCCIKYGHHRNHHHHHHHHHHHRHHEWKTNQTAEGSEAKELCTPNCWCNNLVEIKIRYPTKIISFVSLIEPNFSNPHLVNMAAYEKFVKISPYQLYFKNEESELIDEFDKTLTKQSYSINQMNAIDMRKLNVLSRISESSVTKDSSPVCEKSDLEKIPEISERIITESLSQKLPTTPRKLSFDFTNSNESSESKLFHSTNNFMRSTSVNQKTSNLNINQMDDYGLDPSQVFLHIFQNQHFFSNEKEHPILIPDTENIKRSLDILDLFTCFWLHKAGVVYLGPNQTDEKSILLNANGSIRYRNFVNGLGNLVHLRDMDTNQFYPGGLNTDGTVGDFAVLWYDGIIQILFHVATMMKTEENTNSKKRHIGNDSVIVVYNESGQEYNFNMIKGEVNCVCIEIIPLKANTNILKVKTTSEMSQWFSHSDPQFVSDQNLSLIVRKMALHADIASKVCRSQKENPNSSIYGGRFYDRLKQINRIKKLTKDNQKPQLNKPSSQSDLRANLTINTSDKTQIQFDFLDYI